MPCVGGKHDGTLESYAKMRGARGKLCKSATLLKTAHFHPECEVFVWRGSPNIPKKLIVPYGTITFGTLKVMEESNIMKTGPLHQPKQTCMEVEPTARA